MSLAKPKMRGLLATQITKNITVACILGVVSAVAWKFGIMEPRKKRYADFYKTYDADADFERMRKLGLFQSCPADD
ncbi:cytochrome c oxidase subunit 6C-1 [Armadillidium vulgare]|nr:cytochrome c oxidase subunit 6C-1 [Armadillidium vulgare]